ncbi:hypothetical protein IV38_GL000097 [Lactobacillus selangorensis]|uniref:DUF6440 domain-containing protein n=1 Tax=Lactobacillus selangorensis TaxID=81857 RepID=A0A0R2FKQ9_9LACO|nr:DUF6440 family protein [Lactobacillus selangorensis]KRN29217.1 hypothetical protein IV38_GL000097 [Lactobacillus selangorensis]KRN31425.1 hypothetical protein IV40_GL001421 [Lactobacillus selangorensis]
MKKKIVVFASLLVMGVSLAGCSEADESAKAQENSPLKFTYNQDSNGRDSTKIIHDKETGVEYIVVESRSAGEDGKVAVTPRLNADGTVYHTEVKK